MKALICQDNQIKMVEKPVPEIQLETDAIIKVEMSSICTSDLHIIKGFVPSFKNGTTLGHEFVGSVVEVGSKVKNFKKGFINNCINGGWMLGNKIDGAQAEFVRIPYADTGLAKIPDNVSFKEALFVGDILSSGYWGAELCEIKEDETVAVIGLGPVGLCAGQCAKLLGAKKVIGLDINPKRLELALELGFIDEAVNPKKDELPKNIDCVIECAGSDGSFEMAYTIARANAIIALVAMYEKDQILPLPKIRQKPYL